MRVKVNPKFKNEQDSGRIEAILLHNFLGDGNFSNICSSSNESLRGKNGRHEFLGSGECEII